MDIEVKIHCAPLGAINWDNVKKILRKELGSENVRSGRGYFEHFAKTVVPTHKNAEELMHKLRIMSGGQIGSIDYNVLKI